MFHNRNPSTILHFLDQSEMSCDFNGVSEGLAQCILPKSMKEEPYASFNNLLVPIEVSRDA